MTGKIPWPRILAEGLVVVTSILLALGIDAWWSAQTDHQEAVVQVQGLLIELGEAKAELESYDRQHKHLLAINTALGDQLDNAALGSRINVSDTMLAGLLAVGVADPPTALMEAFASSWPAPVLGTRGYASVNTCPPTIWESEASPQRGEVEPPASASSANSAGVR